MQYIVGTRHFTREGNDTPLQYSCQENPVRRSLLGCSPWPGLGLLSVRPEVGCFLRSLVALVLKNLPASVGDVRDPGSIPGSGRSLGGGNGNPL